MPPQLIPAQDGTGYVNGKKVGSKPEWYAALALARLGWNFRVQVSYFGGRTIRGGMVLDILVGTLPKPTPVFIQGTYWHSGARGEVDALQIANLRRQFANIIRNPVLVAEKDILTKETAYQTFKEEFGRAQ